MKTPVEQHAARLGVRAARALVDALADDGGTAYGSLQTIGGLVGKGFARDPLYDYRRSTGSNAVLTTLGREVAQARLDAEQAQ